MPSLSRARDRVRTIACLNNLKQMQLAWQMYADDASGLIPPNTAHNDPDWLWRSDTNTWCGPSSAPYDTDTINIRRGLFYRMGYSTVEKVFCCPSDRSKVVKNEERELTKLPRTRSFAMNGSLHGRKDEVQPIIKMDARIMKPSRLFVFIDEQEDSIDDGHFLVWPFPDDRWVNLPSGRHGQTGILSFADGHVEKWKWLTQKNFSDRENYWKQAKGNDLMDLRRLQAADFMFAKPDDYVPQP